MNNCFIILAGGESKRFNSKIPKSFHIYKGKPLLLHSIDKAKNYKKFKKIVLVINKKHKKLIKDLKINDIKIIEGGNTRAESAYKGLNYGSESHNHSEMEGMLKAMVEVLAKKPQGGNLTKSWKKAFTGVTDAYLGDLPDNMEDFRFDYKGASYSPKSFAKHLDLDMDDYISLTSYTHHPFYQSFVIEVQDNWALQSCYNLPLDEFMDVMEQAIMDGYTFAWGADISEKGFSARDALAILPTDPSTIRVKGKNNKHFSDAGAEKISNAFMVPGEEKIVTQQERQDAFDTQRTTDDHGMHITGVVKDQKGTKYFIVKNSWGESNDRDGYFFASFPYVKYKTLNIQVHKDVLTKELKKKLGIK